MKKKYLLSILFVVCAALVSAGIFTYIQRTSVSVETEGLFLIDGEYRYDYDYSWIINNSTPCSRYNHSYTIRLNPNCSQNVIVMWEITNDTELSANVSLNPYGQSITSLECVPGVLYNIYYNVMVNCSATPDTYTAEFMMNTNYGFGYS